MKTFVPATRANEPAYPPAPPHWDVHYVDEFRKRYMNGNNYRPLSPSHQKTETHESFSNIDGPHDLWRPLSLRPFTLENHQLNGPSKVSHVIYLVQGFTNFNCRK